MKSPWQKTCMDPRCRRWQCVVVLIFVICGGRTFLEATGRWGSTAENGWRVHSGRKIPWNLFSPKVPFPATLVPNQRQGNGTHITLSHHGKVPFLEGQSIGVMEGCGLRLYPISSSRMGDDERSKTLSIYVESQGAFSNLKVGDKLNITGPLGTEMLLPPDLHNTNLILVATEHGVAPFRGQLRWLFHDSLGKGQFKGLAWLFVGGISLPYDKEFRALERNNPCFRYLSIQAQSEAPSLAVQRQIKVHSDEVWKLLQSQKSHLYISGKGLEEASSEFFLGAVAAQDWIQLRQQMRQQQRYHCSDR